MATVKNKLKINREGDKEIHPKWNKYDKGTAIAFSGDLKYWTGFSKGKPLF